MNELGMSFSAKNGAFSFPITKTLLPRSMEHWCLRNMSRPRINSKSWFSKIVNEQVKNEFPICIGAVCTRPMIRAVPTPLATPVNEALACVREKAQKQRGKEKNRRGVPEKRLSTSLIMPQRSAHWTLIIVC